MLTTTDFTTLLHYINNNNSNVIDPLSFAYNNKSNIRIKESRTYYFPMVRDYHWVLFDVEYV